MPLGSVPAARPQGSRSRREVIPLSPLRHVWVLVHTRLPKAGDLPAACPLRPPALLQEEEAEE